jgi:hypothetical protein
VVAVEEILLIVVALLEVAQVVLAYGVAVAVAVWLLVVRQVAPVLTQELGALVQQQLQQQELRHQVVAVQVAQEILVLARKVKSSLQFSQRKDKSCKNVLLTASQKSWLM